MTGEGMTAVERLAALERRVRVLEQRAEQQERWKVSVEGRLKAVREMLEIARKALWPHG